MLSDIFCISDKIIIAFVESPSCVQLFMTPRTVAHQASQSLTISQSSRAFIALVVPSSHLILQCPLLLLPSIFPSIGLFQWVICSYQMTKILELQLQYQSFQWIFRVDLPWDWLLWSPCCWSDFQESYPVPQFEGINSSAFSKVQFSQPYMTNGNTIALTIGIFISRVMSLLFNILPRFVIAFLLSSNHLLILWPQSPSRITTLSWRRGLHNSMKLWAMMSRATQNGWVTAQSSDKMWSTGGGNGKPPQYTCHEDLMNCIKGQKYHRAHIKLGNLY